MNIKEHYAIFDMDGTLVSSMQYWDQTCKEFLFEQGLHTQSIFDAIKPMTLQQSAAYLQTQYGCSFSGEEMSARMCAIMQVHYAEDVRVKPGVIPFLDVLKESGVRMCVASSSPEYLVETCLQSTNLQKYFEFSISAESVGKGKTEPDIYYAASEKLGGTPSDTVVFEDAFKAGETARRAGFSVAAVYDETGKAEWDTFRRLADYVICDWEKL